MPNIWNLAGLGSRPHMQQIMEMYTVFFFARRSFFLAGFRTPELRSLASVEICNVELRSIEFDRSSNLRNGASAFDFLFRKITLLISDWLVGQ
jgi:hypothetical protein